MTRPPMADAGNSEGTIYAIAPAQVEVAYLTAGKAYAVHDADEDGFWTHTDGGEEMFASWRECAHLNGGDWKREVRK